MFEGPIVLGLETVADNNWGDEWCAEMYTDYASVKLTAFATY